VLFVHSSRIIALCRIIVCSAMSCRVMPVALRAVHTYPLISALTQLYNKNYKNHRAYYFNAYSRLLYLYCLLFELYLSYIVCYYIIFVHAVEPSSFVLKLTIYYVSLILLAIYVPKPRKR